jgi:hypothetical protein
VWHPERGGLGVSQWRNWLPTADTARYVLRLGQAQFQLWRVSGRRLILQDSRSAEQIAYNQYQTIASELSLLTQALPAGAGVTLLADSKWMPLSLLNTGQAPLTHTQVQTLAMHQFAQTYGEEAQQWRIQTSYVSGDEQTLAFACAELLLSSVKQALDIESLGASRRAQLLSAQPTFAWAWNHVRSHEVRKSDEWLVLAEHDRSVMARIARGRVFAFHAAGPILRTPAQLAAALQVQALRCGLTDEGRQNALGVSLEPVAEKVPVDPDSGVRWHAFGMHEHEVVS